jgi:hypothetical protein
MNAQITELEALDAPSEWGDFAIGVGVGALGAAAAVGVGVALT